MKVVVFMLFRLLLISILSGRRQLKGARHVSCANLE